MGEVTILDVWFKAPLTVALLSMLVAQMVKVPIHFFSFINKFISNWPSRPEGCPVHIPQWYRRWLFFYRITAWVCGRSFFAVASILALIVMYDAMGIRRHAGRHAVTLNRLLNEKLIGQPSSDKKTELKQQLKEMLGHEPKEVIWGAVTGIIVALIVGLI